MAEEADQIISDIMETVDEMLGELEVEAVEGVVPDYIINIAEPVDMALDSINSDMFDIMLSEDPVLELDVRTDVSSTVDTVVSQLEESGVSPEDVGGESASQVARGSSEASAAVDELRGFAGFWERTKQRISFAKQVANVLDNIKFVAEQIYNIAAAIKDGTEHPSWKGNLTDAEKKNFLKLQDATKELAPLLRLWQAGLETLEAGTAKSYGTMTVVSGGREVIVEVLDVVAFLVDDGIQQMLSAEKISQMKTDDLTVIDIKRLSNNIFSIFADAQALINLRNNKDGRVKNDSLDKVNFPDKTEDKRVYTVLLQDFPEWIDDVQNRAMELAKMGATSATTAFVRSQAVMKINAYLRENIYPTIQEAAKQAGTKAANDYVDSQREKLITLALIPVVGPEKAEAFGKEVKTKAIELSHAAAINAGERKAKELQMTIESALKPIVQSVVDDNMDTVKQIGKYAAQQILNDALLGGSKISSRQVWVLPQGVAPGDIALGMDEKYQKQ